MTENQMQTEFAVPKRHNPKMFQRPKKRDRPRCGIRNRNGSLCRAPVMWLAGQHEPMTRCVTHLLDAIAMRKDVA